MKILAIFHSKIFCKNQGNFSDNMLTENNGLVPIITTSLFWWSNVLVRWSKCQINSHRGVLQKLYNFRWLAASLWEKLDTTAQSVFDRADSWTGNLYRHLAAKRWTYTVKSPLVSKWFIVFINTLSFKQVTSCSMHSIVTTFRGADIEVEVANFCAAMDRSRWRLTGII